MTAENYIILFGGRSTEHDASTHSFYALYEVISENDKHLKQFNGAVFIGREGTPYFWSAGSLHKGYPSDFKTGVPMPWPEVISMAAANQFFVFNLLHGNEGEDGNIQGLAKITGLRGSFGSVFAASFTMSKWTQNFSIAHLSYNKVQSPKTYIINRFTTTEEIAEILAGLNASVVVKPNSLGASLFTEKFETGKKDEVLKAVKQALLYDGQVLLQQFIKGEEYTCGCIEENGEIISLPIIRAHTAAQFLGHKEKHKRGLVEVEFIDDENILGKRISAISALLFKQIGLSNMARFDYIYHRETDIIYYLECNSIPGLGHGSAFPQMLVNSGRNLIILLDNCLANYNNTQSILNQYQYAIEH